VKRVLITGMSGTGKSSLLHELAVRGHRTTNPYGRDPAELAETLQYQQTVEPLLRASATLEVVITVPVARVADIVLDHVLGTKP
jgi:predicted ATPase